MKTTREIFLTEFLSALGAKRITYNVIQGNLIEGHASHETDNSDTEEIQHFRWQISEMNAPSKETLEIVKVINEDQLLNIDQLSISKDELFAKLSPKLSSAIFTKAFDELLDAEVAMLDDGKETDAYYIHL